MATTPTEKPKLSQAFLSALTGPPVPVVQELPKTDSESSSCGCGAPAPANGAAKKQSSSCCGGS
jgi:hypothetical protein